MASTTTDLGKWKNLKAAMVDLTDLLRCWTCNKVFQEPVSYRCGHFFCADCAKRSGTKCGTCNVPSLPSEIRQDRIVSAVAGCFQKLSTIINNEERSEESISCTSTNNGKKSSRSTVYEYRTLDDPISSLDQEKTKISDDTRENLQDTENENISLNIQTKLSRKTSEKFSGLVDKETQDENFVKPADVKKPQVKGVKKAGGRKKSLPPCSTAASNQKDECDDTDPEKGPAEKKTVKNLSSKSDESKTERPTSDEEFPKDAFLTPKKPRRSNKFTNLPSASKTPEIDLTVKYTPRKSNTPGRELSKKNHKGETPLHVACIKGNVERIRTLLNANATPNTKDNAGWTPLHEAAIRGFTEVVELLVGAGALIDVPGSGNVTPLHEAVIYNHIPIVKHLVAHGADIHARSSEGKTPLDLATSSEMKEALLHTEKRDQISLSESGLKKNDLSQQEMVLCGESNLTPEEKIQICSLAVTLDARLVPAFGSEVTHFIVPSGTDCTCPPSLEVLCAILRGVLILTRDWISVCQDGEPVDVDLFELAGINDFRDSETPKRSRINAQKQLPGLFNGCHFYITSNVQYRFQTCDLTRSDIITLVKSGGGIVLTRQPDPEAIPANEKTVPYHAPREGSLTATSHFILYVQGKGEPELKYNMKHCKTLPVEWFIQCIVNWRLLDP